MRKKVCQLLIGERERNIFLIGLIKMEMSVSIIYRLIV